MRDTRRKRGYKDARCDAFDHGIDTEAHKINLAMKVKGQTIGEIAAISGCSKRRVSPHMTHLKKRGFANNVNHKWAITKLGVTTWNRRPAGSVEVEIKPVRLAAVDADISESDEKYEPDSTDHRDLVERQIRERRGQSRFRDNLRKRYGDKCLVSGCTLLAVIEAAHISPYRGTKDNNPSNGLLLRADLHTLFDLDLLGIEPNTLRVELHPDLKNEYGEFHGVTICTAGERCPSQEALQRRHKAFMKRKRSGA